MARGRFAEGAQEPPTGPLVTSTLDRTLNANSLLVLDSQQPSNPTAQVGSAQLLTNQGAPGSKRYLPSGIGLKLFGFIAESVFTFIPEHCSGSSWNAVRNHPGIAFPFTRIPHR